MTEQRKVSWQNGHRERLRQKFQAGKLVDYELMELLLGYAIPRRDVRPVARELLQRYGGIYQVLVAPIEELTTIPGLGQAAATYIKILHSLMVRGYNGVLKQKPIFFEVDQLLDYCRLLVGGKTIEEFHVLYLDKSFRLLADDLHSSGTVDWAAVYPKEILKRVLDLGARSVVMLHNHPTPNMSFSNEDIELTRTVQAILHTIDVELYDHLLVSGNLVYSAKNMFLLLNSNKKPDDGNRAVLNMNSDF